MNEVGLYPLRNSEIGNHKWVSSLENGSSKNVDFLKTLIIPTKELLWCYEKVEFDTLSLFWE